MENYGAAKARVFENQDENQYLVINYDDKVCYALAKDCKAKVVPFSRLEELDFGAFVKEGYIVIKNEQGETVRFCKTEELNIPGAHNLENALAAAAVAYFAGIDPEVITKALVEFQGVEHRIEFCGEVDGVRFINDSKGTNPEASMKAIDAMKGGIILIAGGYDKGSSFDELIKAFDGRVKHMVLLGKTAPMIKETAERLGFVDSVIVEDMEACVNEAFRIAEKGDNVLLSPACASWDMYKSFEHRGEHFKECVKKLSK
jgi:UDP-N-acetylmuramoylalanine--D-glutamate ligase